MRTPNLFRLNMKRLVPIWSAPDLEAMAPCRTSAAFNRSLALALKCALPVTVAACLLVSGCSTPPLTSARSNFYAGRYQDANKDLESIPEGDKDTVLYLMERGMVRQQLGDYEGSAKDWRHAIDLADELETYSLSKGAASLLSNDRALAFRGKPFERTLLYTMLAKTYMGMQNWNFVGICGRNIITQLEDLNGYPDIAYSRYMAAVCLEIMNDPGNAAIQYKKINQIQSAIYVDPETGFLFPAPPEPEPTTNAPLQQTTTQPELPETPKPPDGMPDQLVCFVGLSGALAISHVSSTARAPYVEIYAGNRLLGRSYALTNTRHLMSKTIQRQAVLEAMKTGARIATKEAISAVAENQNETAGAITRLILFALEMPDDRQWETIPLWLCAARVYCPDGLKEYRVEFKNPAGQTVWSRTIEAPISRRGKTYYTFFRDIVPQPPAPATPPTPGKTE